MEPILDGSGDTKRAPLPASTTPWLADLDRGLAKAVAIAAVIGVATFTLDPSFATRLTAAAAPPGVRGRGPRVPG